MGLYETVQDKAIRASIAQDCVQLMDAQVASKSGLSGMALKATYGVVKSIGPSYIPGALERLIPDAFRALDPMWQKGVQAGDPVAYLSQNSSTAADRVLSVTDARIETSNNKIVRSSYNKLRKSVKNDVETAIPGLAVIIGNHIG